MEALTHNNARFFQSNFVCPQSTTMAKKFTYGLRPAHPERNCLGYDKYCPADSLACGNGSGRTQHPAEMLGEDWYKWGDWGIDVSDEEADKAS